MYFDEISRYSDGNQIGLAIINTEGRHGLNDVFTDEGLASIFDAAD